LASGRNGDKPSMSNEPEEQDGVDDLEEQKGVLLPPREAMTLINPAPGDMPVDPPTVPLPFGPLDDVS
jgi:hypothetical protein